MKPHIVVVFLPFVLYACSTEYEHAEESNKTEPLGMLDLSIPENADQSQIEPIANAENKLPDLFGKSEDEKTLTVNGSLMLAPGDSITDAPEVEGATVNIEIKTD